jgi:hypothetical protein
MPKQERNKQFVEIEERIGTYLLEQKKSDKKKPIHFDEFEELKEMTRQFAEGRGMSLAEWYRWLNYRYLSVHNFIPVEVEKQKLPPVDFTYSKPKRIYPKSSDNGLKAYLKIFGNDFQRKVLNEN